MPGVQEVTIEIDAGIVIVRTAGDRVKAEALRGAVEDAGFGVQAIETRTETKEAGGKAEPAS